MEIDKKSLRYLKDTCKKKDQSLENPSRDDLDGVKVTNDRISEIEITYDSNSEGMIPRTIGDPCGFEFLTRLVIRGNYYNLRGTIPAWIGYLNNLEYLDLSHNNLEGHIPHSFNNLTNLKHISLHCNNLIGDINTIPLSKCRKLTDINLYGNKFWRTPEAIEELNKKLACKANLGWDKVNYTGFEDDPTEISKAEQYEVYDDTTSNEFCNIS